MFGRSILVLDTRIITRPRAPLRQALYLANLLGIAARCPRVHSLVAEKATFYVDIFIFSSRLYAQSTVNINLHICNVLSLMF